MNTRLCIECSEEISPKRLAAVPTAERCVPCQENLQEPRLKLLHEYDADGQLVGEVMWTRNPHLDDYIARSMKGLGIQTEQHSTQEG